MRCCRAESSLSNQGRPQMQRVKQQRTILFKVFLCHTQNMMMKLKIIVSRFVCNSTSLVPRKDKKNIYILDVRCANFNMYFK